MIRQPIITVAGHVDHGKTSILDKLRQSSVAAKEAGGITQKISFTLFPTEQIRKCFVIDKYFTQIQIPGLLFIDTPGHAAFTNLRKRGGSLADLAILVIAVNEGIKPQTAEVLQILKANKTPFIIALNKIDLISGWKKQSEDLKKSIESQSISVKEVFNEKLYTLIGSLQSHGFDSDLFYNIADFTKKVALIPCSAKTGEGISDLMGMICGFSQKFLAKRLSLGKDAKGVILEIKKEKAINYIEAIHYDGTLKVGDQIAIATFSEPVIVKIKSIQEILPLSAKFKTVNNVIAATGLRIQITEKEKILPGMPFQIYKDNLSQIEKEFKKEITESIKLDKQGIIVKADSLGSLEALITLLKQERIQILKADIGSITKSDILAGKASEEINPLNAVIVGFNVDIDDEARDLKSEVKILLNSVVYKLIEDLQKWKIERKAELDKAKLLELTSICKLEILHQHVFHNSNPAIFGVKIQGGKAMKTISLINQNGIKIAKIKNIQAENKSVQEATSGMEVAISLPGIAFDRQLKDSSHLYSDMSESQFREFKKNKDILSSDEKKVLQEIAEIKRREKSTWGI
ncbi:MAG: translation initiation factor IF-2 [archaeon]